MMLNISCDTKNMSHLCRKRISLLPPQLFIGAISHIQWKNVTLRNVYWLLYLNIKRAYKLLNYNSLYDNRHRSTL